MGETKKKKQISLMYILGGGILKEDFILRHTKMIVLIVILLFFYISNRYTCLIKIREIHHLQQELIDVRHEAQSISAQLTGNTRPSQVEELVRRQGIGLEKAKTPPYKLTVNN
jgi:cell division protein FtsL